MFPEARVRLDRNALVYLPQEGFNTMEPFVPVPVSDYSEKEFESCYLYYLNRNWLQHPHSELPCLWTRQHLCGRLILYMNKVMKKCQVSNGVVSTLPFDVFPSPQVEPRRGRKS